MPILLALTPLLFALNASDSVPPHDTLTVASRALGEPRRVNVHVPSGYAASANTRYPVLYMPDGGIDEDFPHVVKTVDSLIALGEIRPVIVVGVPNTERRRDLTGPTRVHSDSAIAPHVGGSAAFRAFFRDELIPLIDRRYRTTSERAIIGESLAGLFIVETFLREPGLFDHYVAFDPSLWWNRGALVDSASMLLRGPALNARQSPPTIYFAGSKDVDDKPQRLAGLLGNGPPGKVSWSYFPRPDLTHATIFASLAPAGLISALQGKGGEVVNVWPGVAPGSEKWKQKEITIENTPVGTVIMNVVTPTLTAYLPDPAKATGTGVIIAPGGAFVALAITLEAIDAAKWLQQRGVAAFVLKYRTVEKKSDGIPRGLDLDTAGRYGMADGVRALEVVRQRASQWNVDPHRIGFLGFSAGAMVASATLVQRNADGRPNFAALLYGGPFSRMPVIPTGLPPVFMAWAQDDPIALKPATRFRDALIAAGNKPEVHIYSAGGHGFGMRKQGTSSDHWLEELYYWMEAQGLTKRAAP